MDSTDLPARARVDSLYQRVAALRWPIFIIVVGAAAVHQAILFALLRVLPPAQHSLAQLAIYSLTGVAVVWLGLRQLTRAAASQQSAESRLREAYAELEHTHRQLQTIHEVGQRVTDAGDVQELLEIAARIPVDLLGARSTTVITFDDQHKRGDLEMTWGLSDSTVQALRQQVATEFSVQRCSTCQPLTANVSRECPLLESVQRFDDEQDIGHIVCMPLGRGGERTGVVSAYLDHGTAPSSEEINLVSILTTEITAALEGARLRARQMATLYQVDRATQERRSLNALLDHVLETTVAGWDVPAGAILLLEGDESWTIRAYQGMGDDIGSATFGLALRLAQRARETGQPLILQERAGDSGLASVLVVLLQAEGETLGALFLGSPHAAYFKPTQGELMQAIGSQIALAVRNAQLYSQLRQTAVLEERFRLSREMHDGVAQTLGYLGMQAERLEQLAERDDRDALERELRELRHVIAEAYLDVREAIDGLRLTVDQPAGFAGALRAHADDFTRRSGLPVDCSCVDVPHDLPPDVALHLLRITQEALTNIRRHAGAQHVRVSLARENGHLELTVADDGHGFDPDDSQGRHHVGLASMRERVRSLDGQLTLATSPGSGTRITARVPLR